MLEKLTRFLYHISARSRPRRWYQFLRKSYLLIFRNPLVTSLKILTCKTFNLFYVPWLYSFYLKKLKKLPEETQIFFFSRLDFGPHLLMIHYVRLWQESRGNTCIVGLTSRLNLVNTLAETVVPESTLVCPHGFISRLAVAIFGSHNMYFYAFTKVHALLSADMPNAIYIHVQPSSIIYRGYCTPYIQYFDPSLKNTYFNLSESFLKAYLKGRQILDYKHEFFVDMINLHLRNSSFPAFKKRFENSLADLKEKLRISDKYVVLNINTKDYASNNANRRSINDIEKYNFLINELLKRGYDVVIQGRKEQPIFRKRDGLVDYSKSAFCSVKNDVILYSGCLFSVTSRTGGEIFSTLFDIPILGLNYVDLPCVLPNSKCRFYPKKVRSKSSNRFLSWKEYINSPGFFNIQANNFHTDLEYIELDEEDILKALNEFSALLPQDSTKWNTLTPLQQEFKETLTPLHMDLHYIPGVPCDTYLTQHNKC